MSVNIDDFVKAVESVAPPELAETWDNTGLILRLGDTVSKALIALDVTCDVVEEAIEENCDIVLVHHPLFFQPVRYLDFRKPDHDVAMRLIKAGISLYAAHTSFDAAKAGINDSLSKIIGLNNITGEGFFRIGDLNRVYKKEEFLLHIKRALNTNTLCVSNTQCEKIQRVAVAGGSGGSFVLDAQQAGAEALVTGEAKHSHFIEASAIGILLVAAGHYQTECMFAERIFISLQARLDEVQLCLALKRSERCEAPYMFR